MIKVKETGSEKPLKKHKLAVKRQYLGKGSE